MKVVFISCPLSGDIKQNIKKSFDNCKYVCNNGHIPISPNAMFADSILDCSKKTEWRLGFEMGIELLKRCDEIWVFGDIISYGMKLEIEKAKELNIKIKYIKEVNNGSIAKQIF